MTFSFATTILQKRGFSISNKNHIFRQSLRLSRKSSGQFRNFINSPSNISYTKRSFLYTSPVAKGSITLEAAIAIPLFFLGLFSFICIINIIYLQSALQMALEETVRDVSKEAYISSKFYAMSTEEKSNAINKDSSIVENLGAAFISLTYIREKFLSDDIIKLLDNSFIEDGAEGISFKFSSVDMSTDTLDIILNYKCFIPFIPSELLCFNLSNRCYSKIYMGQEMEKEQKETFFYVYRASTSSVTHTNKYCQYLLNYSKAIRYNDIIRQHPINGCALCANHITIETLKESDAIVYLTSDEDIYHVTLDCQSFTDDIFRFKVSNLENENICQKCLEGK